MPATYTYLLVDFWCLIFPLLFSFHPRLRFYRQWRYFSGPCLVTAVFFLLWDALFTHWGIWWFNPAYVTGIYVGNMPIEELLFFICIPYACVFSYYCFTLLFRFRGSGLWIRWLYTLMALLLLLLALTYTERLYTSVTFSLLGVWLLYLCRKKTDWLPVFFYCYLFLLIPFTLSNGVLTGSFLGRAVVQYDPQHNLGIRLLTIPVEDIFYGMLLLLLNVYGFERLRRARPALPVPVK